MKPEGLRETEQSPLGRWPANVILDEAAGEMLDRQSGVLTSRFFYCAKVSKKERNLGCKDTEDRNCHPTVKPIKLMQYLVRLVTPPEGIVLDPFMGSGTTGCACAEVEREFIGIEKEDEYIEIAKRRIEHWKNKEKQHELFP